jgi:hypothetical protein
MATRSLHPVARLDKRLVQDVVAFAESSQSRVAEIISKVPREQADKKFARRLLEPGHDAPANRGAEREENQGEQDRDDLVTVIAWRREDEKSEHQRFFPARVHG